MLNLNQLKLSTNPYVMPGVTIVSIVSGIVGITPQQMCAKTRERKWVLKRQLAMYLLAENTYMSYTQIGTYFEKDRGTVRHAHDTIKDLTSYDKKFRQYVENLKSQIPNLKIKKMKSEPTKQQIKQFNTLLSKLEMSRLKRQIISFATDGRTDHTKQMSKTELDDVISNLYDIQNQGKTSFKAGQRQRRRIIALVHQLPPKLLFTYWSEEKQKRLVDMDKLNNWLIEKGKYKKPLNDHTPAELSPVIVQFENMLKGYLKKQ